MVKCCKAGFTDKKRPQPNGWERSACQKKPRRVCRLRRQIKGKPFSAEAHPRAAALAPSEQSTFCTWPCGKRMIASALPLRQLLLCGLAAREHLALQAVPVRQVYKIHLCLSGWMKFNDGSEELEFEAVINNYC